MGTGNVKIEMNGQVKSDTAEKQEGIGETLIFLHNTISSIWLIFPVCCNGARC